MTVSSVFIVVPISNSLDHLNAFKHSWSNASNNLVTCCISCNSKKQAKSWRRWLKWLRDVEKRDTDVIRKRVARLRNIPLNQTNLVF